ncbi:MAG TPA: helix-turn-helix domain-containing protein [Nitrososphaeraceae archaeon]|nr:helix-turn-helix domain-containing protein [Nitrososphaeraceae archaeon]
MKKSDSKLAIEWRRGKVLELYSQGNSQSEISRQLQLSVATINRDIFYIRRESKEAIKTYLTEKLPEEFSKCLVGLNLILKESFDIAHEPDCEPREKLQALNLSKDVYLAKIDLISNSSVVDDVMKFINSHKNKLGGNNNNNKNNQNEGKKEGQQIQNEEQGEQHQGQDSSSTVAAVTADDNEVTTEATDREEVF